MFGRRFNGFDDYRKIEFDEVSEREWIKNAHKWGKDVWEIISEKGENMGEKICRNKNEVLKKNKVREYKIGDLVMKKKQLRKNKLVERWEGPFEIIEKNDTGYRLKEPNGKVLVGFFPIEHLRVIQEVFEELDEVEYEVEEILDHKGEPGDRVYKVKWKGYSKPTWEHQSNFSTTECILDYWEKKNKKKKGNKKKK